MGTFSFLNSFVSVLAFVFIISIMFGGLYFTLLGLAYFLELRNKIHYHIQTSWPVWDKRFRMFLKILCDCILFVLTIIWLSVLVYMTVNVFYLNWKPLLYCFWLAGLPYFLRFVYEVIKNKKERSKK